MSRESVIRFLYKSGLELLICIEYNRSVNLIKRSIQKELKTLLKEYPVVSILGPRQSGKTTLAQMLKRYRYCNLENPENRQLALDDPQLLFEQFPCPVIFDEVQRVPTLLSYIQDIVDRTQKNGQFVLTGSHQTELSAAMGQSLAGRVGIIHLLPLSIPELRASGITYKGFQHYAHKGFLPRVHKGQRPTTTYSNYYQTYIERDVRQLIMLKERSLFEKFMKLLAGRVGQVINYESLANDTGVDAKTIKNWLSVLEASFVIYKLSPYFKNFGKRAIKSPKYYFTEVGLLVFLLGIQKPEQILRDPLTGSIFENLVVIECLKARLNKGCLPELYFFRDNNANEIDLIYKDGRNLQCFEIKSASTYNSSMLKNIERMKALDNSVKRAYLIYNGKGQKLSPSAKLLNFKDVASCF